MAEYVICDKEEITSIADTIRSATGTAEPMSLQGIKAGVKSLKPVQPDWSQNDETAQDYVKNRTHYEGMEEVSIEHNGEDGNSFLDGFPIFAIGDIVTVKIDNVEYSLTAFDDDGYVSIGDSRANFDEGTGNGWKFYCDEEDVIFYSKENHTVSYLGNVIHKIDKKFLPFDEFKIIVISGYYEDDWFECNLSFEEAYNWAESNNGFILGIFRDGYSEMFYLVGVYLSYDLSGGRTLDFLFKTLGGDSQVELWYLEDGTITKSNPVPK